MGRNYLEIGTPCQSAGNRIKACPQALDLVPSSNRFGVQDFVCSFSSLFMRIYFPLILFLSLGDFAIGGRQVALQPGWPEETATSRPWTRWWWPGSAVDEEGLTYQLEALANAGLGGVEITPIYGARGREEDYVEFLSPRWVELLAHAADEARRLGLRVDMATGTGWPFGGPGVTPEHAAKRLVWHEGAPEVMPTGQTVKRAAPGGEGLVLDPFSTEAINRYLRRFDEAFADLPGNALRAHFHDSFEYYDANWTSEFPEHFERIHDYRIDEHLPALLGEAQPPVTTEFLSRLKYDYRVTLGRLHEDYLRAWTDWAHGHGWLTRNQSHGAPANLLDLYAIADIPETEVFGSTPFPIPGLRRDPDAIRHGPDDLPEPLVTRMASSAAHVTGKPLVSSETATWLREHWRVTLAAVKPEIDRIFLDGINHVFYHGTVYSPPDAPWPGWLFYASTQFNPNNPWWEDFAALNGYVERTQRILQAGNHGNDVLLYWPVHAIWQDAEGELAKQLTVHDVSFVVDRPFGEIARTLKNAGYAFDYISDRQLADLRVVEGKLKAPGGTYATVVIPPTKLMPLETLQTLLGLARNGAAVIFADWPKDVPGLGHLAERREEFHRLLDSILEPASTGASGDIARLPLDHGVIFKGVPVAALPHTSAVREPMFEQGLECIRRDHAEGTDYFIANLTAEAFDGWAVLGTTPASAVLLDPLSGRGGVAALRHRNKGKVEMRLQLRPGESMIVRALNSDTATGPPWRYLVATGDARRLEGPWSLVFQSGGPTLPEPLTIETLRSWTELGGDETKRFSGTVRYTTTLEIDSPADAAEWLLDLGDLRDSARVHVNGTFVGTVWSLPFRIHIGKYLRPGKNQLMLEVTNVAANRIRDLDRRGVEWKIMRGINFVDINYRPFDASDWKIQPAGLLGPVKLIPMRPAQ